VRRVDRGQRRLDLGRRIDAGDERRIETNPVPRGGGSAFLVHLLVEFAQVLAQIVDGDSLNDGGLDRAASRHDRIGHHGHRRRVEIRNALAQDRNEITHHMRDRILHREERRVEIPLGDGIAQLPGQARVELVLRHRFEHLVVVVGARTFRIERDVERDFIMTAQQAKEYGILDEIIDRPRT